MTKVSRRGGFSDRNGLSPENTTMQIKEFDKRTRIQLQNMISKSYNQVFDGDTNPYNDYIQDFFKYVLGDVYSLPLDARRTENYDYVFSLIEETIQTGTYDEVLTLIEALVQYWEQYLRNEGAHRYNYKEYSIDAFFNQFFQREYIGYRFIHNCIEPISNSYEASTVKEALESRFVAVNEHLYKANAHLADRKNPDYENSIKESISAVEALCEIVLDVKGSEASLGKMLKKLEEGGIIIHPCLKSAFEKLYGYTSDAKGIRHAGNIDGPNATFEEARFMLVSCSAFINYITALSVN